ncbi:RNA polymerase sigma factor SigJ [Streptomyces sp. 549]|uniref:RNA polymerase sigma factor SigJ n=1 Tax=Streptomyces sp. 549 TaxID=3049076 RepID=UPI0024C2DA3F|nr:RNA polymerase sigma factor SigJ [Streptomyces sp. 549]MDK1473486.1 RNA polymerase sigma factor SigJ [Streptomyces sp. 549]
MTGSARPRAGGRDGTGGGGGQEEWARAFEEHRAHLLRVAYTTTGSLAEAEDCVQEAWLRLRSLQDPSQVRDLRAWLTTTVGRLALDVLGSARVRREAYVGTWLPEPLVEPAAVADPADRVTLDETVGMALLIVLERLSPAERTAFLLHDVFGVPFEEVAGIVGRSPAAVRQLASRARRHVEQERPRRPPTRAEQRALVSAFATACGTGDLDGLLALLDPEAVYRSDGGGRVNALRRVERGADRVARVLLAYARRPPTGVWEAEVNGAPGLLVRDADGVLSVIAFTVSAGRFVAVDVVRNPDKLTSVSLAE